MKANRLAGAALLGALLVSIGTTTQAFAGDNFPGGSSSTPPSIPAPEPAATTGKYQDCTVVSGPSYLGLACPGKGNDTRTVKQILGPDPVPDCWDTALTDAELSALQVHNQAGANGWTYYWHRCLTGVDKKTKTVEPGGMHIETGMPALPNSQQPLTLTERQHQLVDGLADNGNVPAPFAAVSPADHPRVGQYVAFWNSSKGSITVRAGTVTLQAHVARTSVEPLGKETAPKIHCPGNGTRAQAGQVPTDGDGICWYKYLHSSNGQYQDVYHVQITSHWVVEVSPTGDPGTFIPWDEFDKSAITQVPVTEIQALVVQ